MRGHSEREHCNGVFATNSFAHTVAFDDVDLLRALRRVKEACRGAVVSFALPSVLCEREEKYVHESVREGRRRWGAEVWRRLGGCKCACMTLLREHLQLKLVRITLL